MLWNESQCVSTVTAATWPILSWRNGKKLNIFINVINKQNEFFYLQTKLPPYWVKTFGLPCTILSVKKYVKKGFLNVKSWKTTIHSNTPTFYAKKVKIYRFEFLTYLFLFLLIFHPPFVGRSPLDSHGATSLLICYSIEIIQFI